MTGQRSDLALADGTVIDSGHCRQFTHCPRAKDLISRIEFVESVISFAMRDFVGRANFENGSTRDSFRAGQHTAGCNLTLPNEKKMCRVRLRDEATQVKKNGIVCSRGVGLNLSQDRI